MGLSWQFTGLPLWGLVEEASMNSEAPSPGPKSRGLWTRSSGRPRGFGLPCQLRGPKARAACPGGCFTASGHPADLCTGCPCNVTARLTDPAQPPSLPAIRPRIFF